MTGIDIMTVLLLEKSRYDVYIPQAQVLEG